MVCDEGVSVRGGWPQIQYGIIGVLAVELAVGADACEWTRALRSQREPARSRPGDCRARGVVVVVGIVLRQLGLAAALLGVAAFFAVQLAVLARSQRQLETARRGAAAARARRQRLRLQRRV